MHVDSFAEMCRQGLAVRTPAHGSLVERNQGQVNHKPCDFQSLIAFLHPHSQYLFKVSSSMKIFLGTSEP